MDKETLKKNTIFTMMIQAMTNERPSMYKSLLFTMSNLVMDKYTKEEWIDLINDLKKEMIHTGWLPSDFLNNFLTDI